MLSRVDDASEFGETALNRRQIATTLIRTPTRASAQVTQNRTFSLPLTLPNPGRPFI